ncbi:MULTISPECIES: phosphatase PAP2 family protein [unclassified Paenibacillus]|uniref:phosphatase PAP2 family protein n=1 Tax=unclassified Paenibacillus TaxID=185978 RepID=UPI0004667F88|nr:MULTISPECIES: phosphatase PAP2 family protein [unclassified Paenibacillus]KGP79028.1 phospholipid phosphatase [Paenibacillus sp. MAEPY2]KGP88225.1 phospholipid phosphatase [Paenibacillus sp. MAEPY1]
MQNLKKNISIPLLSAALSLAVFSIIALSISDNQIHRFDDSLITWIQGMESQGMTRWMELFTWIGSGIPVVIIAILSMVVLYVFLRHRRELLFLGCVIAGSAILNTLLKLMFHRARPTIHRIIEVSGYSFPSGHSMAAFSLYGGLAFLIWKHIPTAVGRVLMIIVSAMFILMIGMSRIYLGVHYPSDVVGGYFMSGCWLAVCIWFYQRYLERVSLLQSKPLA